MNGHKYGSVILGKAKCIFREVSQRLFAVLPHWYVNERVRVAVTLKSHTWDVLASNLDCDTSYQ
jgi:hypothetical protein